MRASWFCLFIREVDKKGKAKPLPEFPLVGTTLVHMLGKSEDPERQKSDKENPLWAKIQDNARPAWAPDFLRKGYAVVFSRTGFPSLAVKLGIKNPRKLKRENGGIPTKNPGGKRVLTFDDVWVVGCEPKKRPLIMPPVKLNTEDWWTAMGSTIADPTLPFIVPGGVDITNGAERLADVVSEMLATPHGYPRPLPTEEDPYDFSEFVNPLVPLRYEEQKPSETERNTGYRPNQGGQNGPGQYAGIELYRYF